MILMKVCSLILGGDKGAQYRAEARLHTWDRDQPHVSTESICSYDSLTVAQGGVQWFTVQKKQEPL